MKDYDEILRSQFRVIKNNRLLISIGCITVIILLIGAVRIMDYHWEEKTMDYKAPQNEYTISGTITDMFTSRGTSYVELDMQKKIYLLNSRNYHYKPFILSYFLSVGDFIVIIKSTDTLFVYREEIEYIFKIGSFINEDEVSKKRFLKFNN